MGKWNYSIDIKQHLGEGTSFEDIAKAASGVISELKRLPKAWLDVRDDEYDSYLDDFICSFESVRDDANDQSENEDDLLEEFNFNLSELYDWADSKRVWLGL